MIKRSLFALVFFTLSILVGCSLPGMIKVNTEPTSPSIPTDLSPSAIPISSASPSPKASNATHLAPTLVPVKPSPRPQEATLESMVSPQPVVLESATPSIPCNRAAPGKPTIDISVPDGSSFDAGQAFSKTWRLVNSGSCDWGEGYAAIWFSGETMGPVQMQPIPPVAVGQSVDITVDLYAPEAAGVHQSNWKLRAADGTLFGLGPAGDAPFWVRIEVAPSAASLTTPAANASASNQPNP